MHSWNLEKIYNEKVRSEGSIPLSRHIIREYSTKSDVKKAIIAADPNLKAGNDKKGTIRIQPKQKITDRESFSNRFIETLQDISLVVVDNINPGAPGSPSSKYPSYVVRDPANHEFIITLGGGAFSNTGMEYERQLLSTLTEYFKNPDNQDKPQFLNKLENYLDVEFVDIDRGTSFERSVKRPLSDEGPDNKGDEISDLTLIDNSGNKYYISIKNVGGKTISNNGAKGMFDVDKDDVKFVNKEKGGIGRKLMEAGGVNIQRAAAGLRDYINKEISTPGQEETIVTTDIADLNKLEKFIGSAFDYGYIYVKQKNNKDDIEVVDLTTPEDLYNFIGDIIKVEVKYPYFKDQRKSRKHISIVITTTKGVYSFDIRNVSGGDLPNQINLVRGKSMGDINSAKSNIVSLSDSDKYISDSLSDL